MRLSRRLLAVLLAGSLVGGLIPPDAAQAAGVSVLPNLEGGAWALGASAKTGVGTPLTLRVFTLPASLTPLAPAFAPTCAVPGAAVDTPRPASAAASPAAGVPAAPKDSSSNTLSSLSRAAELFEPRAAPAAAGTDAAIDAVEAGEIFDGAAAVQSDASPAIRQGRFARLHAGLSHFAARRLAAYAENRAVSHDDFGGPKYDGPMSFGARIRYGLKTGLDLAGLKAIIGLTIAPLMSLLAWPLWLSPSVLGRFGRVELLVHFGPNEIAAKLLNEPLLFLGLTLPVSTAVEELVYRFFDFGLTFGLIAAAKPLTEIAADLLERIPDAAGLRSTIQRASLAVGRLAAFHAFTLAALTSSYHFAAAHFAKWGIDPTMFALDMAAGYVLARAAYKTRGLTAPLVAHIVFNFLWLGSTILDVAFHWPAAAALFDIAVSIAGVVALFRSWRAHKRLAVAALLAGSLLVTTGRSSSHSAFAPASHAPPGQVQTQAAPGRNPAVAPTAPAAIAASGFKTDADMIASVKPSVVQIIVNVPQGIARGSGVIVSPNGLLVTNAHVVGDSSVGGIVSVKFANAHLPATIMAVNHDRDLSILQLPQLKNGSWPYSTFATIAPREGDALFAMGYPLSLPFTVTKGILSGLDVRGNMFVQYLQTDAAITYGNSGGPIYNERGEIVGINTTSNGGGIAFSIVASNVISALSQYADTGNIATAALGAIVDLSTPVLPARGVAVEVVRPGSAAARAGLRGGDLIVGAAGRFFSIGGRQAVHGLASVLAHAKPGDSLELAVSRRGSNKLLIGKLTLDARATSEETSLAHSFD